jgi:ribosome recycling factor
MDVSDIKSLHTESKKRMDAVLDHVRRELAGVRTGRASINLLDGVQVEAWGSMLPLNQVASLSVPANDGKVVRIPLPPLTEERRKELSKLVHKHTEEGRNGIRQVRRDANDRLKKLLKDHTISEDDERGALADVQKATDAHIGTIDDMQKKKDAELLNK